MKLQWDHWSLEQRRNVDTSRTASDPKVWNLGLQKLGVDKHSQDFSQQCIKAFMPHDRDLTQFYCIAVKVHIHICYS